MKIMKNWANLGFFEQKIAHFIIVEKKYSSSIIQPSIIQIFNYLTSKIILVLLSHPSIIRPVTRPRGSDNRGYILLALEYSNGETVLEYYAQVCMSLYICTSFIRGLTS